jgi:hypothetical protein
MVINRKPIKPGITMQLRRTTDRFFITKAWAIAVCLTVFLLSGCVKKALDDFSNDPGKAKIMIVQASPNTATDKSSRYNLVLDGVNLYSCPVGYSNMTGYFPTAPGSKSLQLDSMGVASKDASQCVGPTAKIYNTNFAVEADKFYSLFVLDTVGSIKTLLLEDNLTPPTRESGNTLVRFVNATPDTPALTISIEGGQALFSNVGFTNSVSFKEVKAGLFNLEIRSSASPVVLKKVENVALESGKMYTVFSRGFANPKLDKEGNPINPVDLSTIINYYIFP